MAASPAARRRYPLHLHVTALFSLLVLATGAALAWLGYAESRELSLGAADRMAEELGRATRAGLQDAFAPVGQMVDVLAEQPLASAATLEERLAALPVLALTFAHDAPAAAAYVGYPDGAFFLLRPLRNDAARQRFAAPADARFLVDSIEMRGGARTATYVFLDAALREIGRRTRDNDGFDPRSRPWYREAAAASGGIRTAPYVFFSTASPGVTLAARTRSGSVVGIDVTLHQMSDLLRQLRPLPGTALALMDPDGRVFAASDDEESVVRREGDGLVLARSAALAHPALQRLRPGVRGVEHGALDGGGQEWKTAVLEIPSARGALWLAIAMPLDVLLADARDIRNRGLLAALAVLLVALPLTYWAARLVARSLRALTRHADDIRAFRFDGPPAPASPILEIDQLANGMDRMRDTIRRFQDIATALNAERHFDALLRRLAHETAQAVGAAGGAVYLLDETGERLTCAAVVGADAADPAHETPVARDAGSPIAQAFAGGRTVVAHARPDAAAGTPAFVAQLSPGADATVVAIPLRNRDREGLGVLAIVVPGSEAPSAARLAFAEALSGNAAVAIETKRLNEDRKALLDAFIRLLAGAIDAKSPYTGGHCQRVPELTLMLARAACAAQEGPLRDFDLDEEQWEALQIASWLHDCGKVTTPEYVVDKATKLETIYDRIHEVRMRFEVLKRDAAVECWRGVAEGAPREAALAALRAAEATLDEEFRFVAECNVGGEFLDKAKIERLRAIGARTWTRTLDDRIGISHEEAQRKARAPAAPLPAAETLLADKPEHVIERAPGEALAADNPWGFRMAAPALKYNRGELANLAIARGTLTEEERYVINHHIVQTIVMLSQLPFPRHLRGVPEIAGGHHEKMDGTGYPRGLARDDMSWAARMMAIADIFEALTAADRPYKKGKTLSESLKIMSFMRRDRHIDPDLFDLFLSSGIYREYAARFLRPEQIDAVDVRQFMGAAA
jgi:HD-GYP domain-containing protein (c-di-GMP phosphodiesterase class II)/HAMP domain-containing protein